MKASLIVLLALTITTIGSVSAKQAETTPSPRVISQEEGLTVGDQSNKPADVAVTKQIRTELMKMIRFLLKVKM